MKPYCSQNNASIARGKTGSVGVFDFDTKTSVITQDVVRNQGWPGSRFQAHNADPVIRIIKDRVARDGYARSRTILQLDTATVIVGNNIVADDDVLLEAVPDDNASGSARMPEKVELVMVTPCTGPLA